ncbi:excinuclease ABC subunit UvrA [Mesorhizobium sp.]|uniref:excinuclease ABC subunit UvrA n=1 Tax=Mesorhizobium sp. TaxID=1871066 RepID=UPI0025D7BEB2|nr:excinuclease ABC subunit UvrA [Mesorhizobium sp.]
MTRLRRPRGDVMRVVRARENNLKNVSVEIPKRLITVFTGVSGSGKSSLVFDTVAAESQRQLNETFPAFVRNRLPHYGQPDADALENLSPAIIVDQKRIGGNARSTVGTATDIYALLRLLFSRVGSPFVGESSVFSFNHPEGMCPTCLGLGTVVAVDEEKLVDRSKSLNEGALTFPGFKVGGYRWKRYVHSGLFDNDKPLERYTKAEWRLLMHQTPMTLKDAPAEWYKSSKYEGVVERFTRSYLKKSPEQMKPQEREAVADVITRGRCPTCNGYRLNAKILACKIDGCHIGELAALSVSDLIPVVRAVEDPRAVTIVAAIVAHLESLAAIGLSYLSLDRQTPTLSGGESQRLKIVRHLGSSLSDMTYILDEPSIGLHPRDVHQLNNLIVGLRDKGNTVIVVEHDPDVIAIADHVVDMGPGAGAHGGTVVFEGTVAALAKAKTPTGRFLHAGVKLKTDVREAQGSFRIRKAKLHNLTSFDVDIPRRVLTVVTGVAGSGKSSLINGVLMRQHPDIICVDQGALTGSIRSNIATYTGVLDPVRDLFAEENGTSPSQFSANSAGACPACRGLGEVTLDLAFMDSITSICEACHGRRFRDDVLAMTYRGKAIDEVLKLTAEDAAAFFADQPPVSGPLGRVVEVGLGYLALGQPLSTLSGGERQRIKLATELQNSGQTYVLDEPTTGLHMSDVARLIALMDRLVDNGSSVIAIEHNLDVIARADWIIDMGPGAGRDGGRVVAQGTPEQIINDKQSITGPFLKARLGK